MTGEEHYREAEKLIDMVTSADDDMIVEAGYVENTIAAAQVHATLAMAYSHLPVTMVLQPEVSAGCDPAALAEAIKRDDDKTRRRLS